jgi:hypothetical protein
MARGPGRLPEENLQQDKPLNFMASYSVIKRPSKPGISTLPLHPGALSDTPVAERVPPLPRRKRSAATNLKRGPILNRRARDTFDAIAGSTGRAHMSGASVILPRPSRIEHPGVESWFRTSARPWSIGLRHSNLNDRCEVDLSFSQRALEHRGPGARRLRLARWCHRNLYRERQVR